MFDSKSENWDRAVETVEAVSEARVRDRVRVRVRVSVRVRSLARVTTFDRPDVVALCRTVGNVACFSRSSGRVRWVRVRVGVRVGVRGGYFLRHHTPFAIVGLAR